MNFEERCKKFEYYSVDEIIRYQKEKCINKNEKNSDIFYSYNHKTVINQKTKFVIVGTFTPPCATVNEKRNQKNYYTMNKYYFYCSKSKNQYMYHFIDCSRNCNLDNKRYLLPNKKIVEDIKKILINLNIAFLDVIELAVVNELSSSSDDNLICFNLDYKAFEDAISINKNIVFIPNSKNALTALKIIKKHIKSSLKIAQNSPCFQSPRAARLGKGTKQKLERHWKDALN